jgi:hypothetical protein
MSDPLLRAHWTLQAGYADLLSGFVHLVIGYRTTCGRSGATIWTRERVGEFLAEYTDDVLDELADELLAEAADTTCRLNMRERRS